MCSSVDNFWSESDRVAAQDLNNPPFGIQRVLQTGESPQPNGTTATGATSPLESSSAAKSASAASYRQQVNTNLVEISDWLTRIVVSLGLINLKDVPGLIDRTVSTLAHGLATQASCVTKAPCSDYPFAVGLVTAFSVASFLLGYLYEPFQDDPDRSTLLHRLLELVRAPSTQRSPSQRANIMAVVWSRI